MDLNFAQAVVVRFWILKKGKSSEIDLQDTCGSPRDPLSQQAVHVQLKVLSTKYEYIYQNLS